MYGNELSGVSRAEGCRDTNLVTPVGPLNRDDFRSKVEALEGKGRTPIGRSLLKAPDDLGPSGDRTVILVSDGGDNCAPPPPCEAARRVSQRGVKLSISVVGLQVNERVRRQLKCIAEAGGGTYVDASDPEALKRELLAAFARAFRGYEPSGTPVQGAPELDAAPVIGEGQYLDGISPGEEKFYAVDVKPGQKLYASAVAIPPRDLEGSGAVRGAADHAGGRGAQRRARGPRLRRPRPVREHQGARDPRRAGRGAGDRERRGAGALALRDLARDRRPRAR